MSFVWFSMRLRLQRHLCLSIVLHSAAICVIRYYCWCSSTSASHCTHRTCVPHHTKHIEVAHPTIFQLWLSVECDMWMPFQLSASDTNNSKSVYSTMCLTSLYFRRNPFGSQQDREQTATGTFLSFSLCAECALRFRHRWYESCWAMLDTWMCRTHCTLSMHSTCVRSAVKCECISIGFAVPHIFIQCLHSRCRGTGRETGWRKWKKGCTNRPGAVASRHPFFDGTHKTTKHNLFICRPTLPSLPVAATQCSALCTLHEQIIFENNQTNVLLKFFLFLYFCLISRNLRTKTSLRSAREPRAIE